MIYAYLHIVIAKRVSNDPGKATCDLAKLAHVPVTTFAM
jgi:hypothetical protein